MVEECVEKFLTNLSAAACLCETGLFIGQVKSHIYIMKCNAPNSLFFHFFNLILKVCVLTDL